MKRLTGSMLFANFTNEWQDRSFKFPNAIYT